MANLLSTVNADILLGTDTDDLIFGLAGYDAIFGLQGNDRLHAGQGNDRVWGGQGNDLVFGNLGNDWLRGDLGNDTLYGGKGSDSLRGGKGADELLGDRGNDVLFGDLGPDTLTGGPGADKFVLARVPNAETATTGGPNLLDADFITDFEDGTDFIALAGGLRFQDLEILTITPDLDPSGQFGNATVIRDLATGEFLAILPGINPNQLSTRDFTTNLDAIAEETIATPNPGNNPGGNPGNNPDDNPGNNPGNPGNNPDDNPGNNPGNPPGGGNPPPPPIDLTLSKTDSADPVNVDDSFNYILTVQNLGTATASGITVEDVLPDGLELGTPTASNGFTPVIAGNTVTFTGGVLNGGASAMLTIPVLATTAGIKENTAIVDPANTIVETNENNNEATATTTVALRVAPDAVDDPTPALLDDSTPASDLFHIALNGTLSTSITSNDTIGNPQATGTFGNVVLAGGAPIAGAVTDNAFGDSVVLPGGGSLAVTPVVAGGTLDFTPPTNFTGLVTFDYRLTNSEGFDDATVTIAVGERPDAGDDAFTSLGNVGITVPAANGVLSNDAGDQLSLLGFGASLATADVTPPGNTITLASGSTVLLNADGSFAYDPAPGLIGNESFFYTIANGFGPATAEVVLTINDRIWFINDNASGSANLGTLDDPFTSLAAFNAVNGAGGNNPGAGDDIFLHAGSVTNYANGITLLNNQTLTGQGATGSSLANLLGLTLPTFSNPLPAINGTRPFINNAAGHGITLGQNNTIQGVNVGNASGWGISGGAVGTLTIVDLSMQNTIGNGLRVTTGGTVNILGSTNKIIADMGAAIDLTNVVADITLSAVTSTGSGDDGIDLDNVSGQFTVTGVTTITNPADNGITIGMNSSVDVSFNTLSITNTGRNGIQLENHTGDFSVASGTISNVGALGAGVAIGRGNGDFTYNGNITIGVGDGLLVLIAGRTGGAITFANGSLISLNAQGILLNPPTPALPTVGAYLGPVPLLGLGLNTAGSTTIASLGIVYATGTKNEVYYPVSPGYALTLNSTAYGAGPRIVP